MKPLRLVMLLSVVLTACNQSVSGDNDLHRKLVGTWVWAIGAQGGGGVTTLAADGSFISKSTNRWTGGSKEFRYEGKWKAGEGVLTLTCLKTSEPEHIPVGKLDRFKIVRADNRELAILDSSENRTNILQRRD